MTQGKTWEVLLKLGNYPILDTKISFVRSFDFVCHAQGTPPEFCKGLDWRALVELCVPNIVRTKFHFLMCFPAIISEV